MEKKTPKFPPALEAELLKIAEEVLVERSAEARRVAALEIGNKLFKRALDLWSVGEVAAGNVERVSGPIVRGNRPSPIPAPPPAKNPCKWCGQPGVYQPPSSKFDPKPGWLCATHKVFEAQDASREGLI